MVQASISQFVRCNAIWARGSGMDQDTIGSVGRGEGAALSTLFTDSFAASEGAEEGALIGALIRDLCATTPDGQLWIYGVGQGDHLLGAVAFSRMTFAQPVRAVLLSPMAVAPGHQQQGLGQAIIQFGLDALADAGEGVAVTYGDPAYYGRFGFAPVTVDQVAAPYRLSHPHGWLAKPLTGAPLPQLSGPVTCAPALQNPTFW